MKLRDQLRACSDVAEYNPDIFHDSDEFYQIIYRDMFGVDKWAINFYIYLPNRPIGLDSYQGGIEVKFQLELDRDVFNGKIGVCIDDDLNEVRSRVLELAKMVYDYYEK